MNGIQIVITNEVSDSELVARAMEALLSNPAVTEWVKIKTNGWDDAIGIAAYANNVACRVRDALDQRKGAR